MGKDDDLYGVLHTSPWFVFVFLKKIELKSNSTTLGNYMYNNWNREKDYPHNIYILST